MLTSEAVNEYVSSTRGVRTLLAATVLAASRDLPDDAEEATRLLIPTAQALVGTFGEIISVAAADFYNQVRGIGGFSAVLAAPVEPERVAASVRWATAPMFSAQPDNTATTRRLSSVIERTSVNQGHETIYQSGVADPRTPKFARVPVGNTCAWCRLMASRGAVFRSEASAKFRRSHADCDCKVSPVFDGDELPYDRQALLDEYQAARDKASRNSVKSITAQMRADGSTN